MSITKTFVTLLLCTVLLSSLYISCQKEIHDDKSFSFHNVVPNVTINVVGRVTDETGKPVQGAQVVGQNGTAVTNINGEFRLKNVSAFDKAAFIQVKKSGYFTGSRTFVATQGQTHYIEVELLNNASSGTVDATTGGTVSLASGATVTLPALGVVTKVGNAAYTGTVNVAVKWIDPTSDALPRQMPGDLRGINENNAEMGLQSFGMLAVELTGASGQALQIAPGKMAGLKFPVPSSILASAPTTIPLWSFNETNGLWKYEGTAIKTGSHYEAQVSHFSFWNIDAQFPVVDFTATVKDQSGNPLKHAWVKLTRTANFSASYGYTDTLGVVKGKIPLNETLILDVYLPNSSCNLVIHSQNIGPFSSSTNIAVTVPLSSSQATTISGAVVNCTGGPVAGGLVEMVLNNRVYRTSIINGAYSFSINLCANLQTATLLAIDSATNQQGTLTTISINTGINAAGTLTACGSSVAQFINYTLSGNANSILPPTDSLAASVGQNLTGINSSQVNAATSINKQINFSFLGTTTGSYPLYHLFVRDGNSFSVLLQSSPVTVTITEFGSAGGYISGSFSGNVGDSLTSAINPISCNFRVRRPQ